MKPDPGVGLGWAYWGDQSQLLCPREGSFSSELLPNLKLLFGTRELVFSRICVIAVIKINST